MARTLGGVRYDNCVLLADICRKLERNKPTVRLMASESLSTVLTEPTSSPTPTTESGGLELISESGYIVSFRASLITPTFLFPILGYPSCEFVSYKAISPPPEYSWVPEKCDLAPQTIAVSNLIIDQWKSRQCASFAASCVIGTSDKPTSVVLRMGSPQAISDELDQYNVTMKRELGEIIPDILGLLFASFSDDREDDLDGMMCLLLEDPGDTLWQRNLRFFNLPLRQR